MELVKFLERLNSNEYRCPGGHYSRKLTYEEEDANQGHWCYDEDGRQTWVQPRLPEGVTYVLEGACKERLTITLETEWGEMGGTSYSYPVAEGPCAEALGLPDDDDYSHPIWTRMSERRQIRALAEGRLEWTTS
jgi:hypothetical protein